MTNTRSLERQLDAAWASFEELLGIPTVEVTLCQLMFIRSDPLDGAWVTCMAEVSLQGRLSYGFATAHEINDALSARAISEAVERVVWETGVANPPERSAEHKGRLRTAPAIQIGDTERIHFLPADFISPVARQSADVRAEPITSGSAVHQTPMGAMSAGAAEVKERIAAIGGFHARSLGRPMTVPGEVSRIAAAATYCWHDPRTGLVSVAVAGPSTYPRLAMASSLAGPKRTELEALVHSYSEIVQSRAWIRRLAERMQGPRLVREVVDPTSRAEYWCSSPFELAERIITELNGPEPDVELPIPDSSDLYLTSAAKVTLDDGRSIWYARIVAPEYRYALHSASVEQRLFAQRSPCEVYLPHPYI